VLLLISTKATTITVSCRTGRRPGSWTRLHIAGWQDDCTFRRNSIRRCWTRKDPAPSRPRSTNSKSPTSHCKRDRERDRSHVL
jgi:hypothetical protein